MVGRIASQLVFQCDASQVQDIGSLVVERAARLQALAQQKKERKAAPSEASTSGESFQESIIGNPAKAPREARHAFFLFVKAVAAVLG